jgi:hypothetical protein
MDNQITYCLLAEIKSKKSNVKSLTEIFQELVETLFSINFPKGEIRSRLEDLRNDFITIYAIEIPFPTLKVILSNIKAKYQDNITLFKDYSFVIDENVFADHSEDIKNSEQDIDDLKKLYNQFCSINNSCYAGLT